MRNLACAVCCVLLFGCGVESAGTVAAVGKLQAERAREAKDSMDKLQADLNSALIEAEQNRKKAEAAASN